MARTQHQRVCMQMCFASCVNGAQAMPTSNQHKPLTNKPALSATFQNIFLQTIRILFYLFRPIAFFFFFFCALKYTERNTFLKLTDVQGVKISK